MKFEKDFDFESANAQFNKDEIDREFQNKLKLKGKWWTEPFLFVWGLLTVELNLMGAFVEERLHLDIVKVFEFSPT